MINASGDITISGGIFVHSTYASLHGASWQQLHSRASANAIHDSEALVKQGICLEQTRVAVLKLLNAYLTTSGPQARHVFWLSGPAGAGKSAIARTIAQSTSETHQLLGSFFFFTSDGGRNTINPFVPTLAVQVCRRFRQARPYVERAIDDDPLIFSKPPSAQADALIVRPLMKALGESPSEPWPNNLVIVVDGLDECASPQRQVEVIDTLLSVSTAIHTRTPIRLKILLFSRPERWIRNRISQCERAGHASSVFLDDIFNPQADIRVYYDMHFEKIRQEHPMGAILDDWPSDEEMEALMDITGDHFAFAHTMRVFVSDPDEDPTEQLEIALGIIPRSSTSPHAHLDQLYNAIFARIPKKLLPQTMRVIGAILVPAHYALNPSPVLLELVFDLKRGEIQRMFFYLESLFDLGDHVSNWIRVHHKTLIDFLFDRSRSEQYGLFIDKDAVYQDICASVRAIFLRPTRPEPSVALLELNRYFLKLFQATFATNAESPKPPTADLPERPATWAPWAVHFYYAFFPERVTILGDLKPPLFEDYAFYTLKNDLQLYGKDHRKALSVYDSSPFGRVCLVLADKAVCQRYRDAIVTVYCAFIKHAIRSQPGLLELDRAGGWNLYDCDADNLIKASMCFYSQPQSYILSVLGQFTYDSLDPNWQTSRLSMLLPWHQAGHRLTDDPWIVENPPITGTGIESLADCPICLNVFEICKAEIIAGASFDFRFLDKFVHQKLFDYVLTRPVIWNHVFFMCRWTTVIENNRDLFDSDPQLKATVPHIQGQWEKLKEGCLVQVEKLVLDGLDEDIAAQMVYQPYSRACVPLVFSDEHALRVAKRRLASMNGTELPDVMYTCPGS